MKQLPDKPSELIMLALGDLNACMNDPDYVISMSDWHTPKGQICEVCLAGSVMAKSLGIDKWQATTPQHTYSNEAKLEALDNFRIGWINEGLLYMGYKGRMWINRRIPIFHLDKEGFFMAMTELANDLAEKGL